MPIYKVVAQIYKEITVKAETSEDAKNATRSEIEEFAGTNKYYISEPKDLDKAEAKKQEYVRKLKEKKAKENK